MVEPVKSVFDTMGLRFCTLKFEGATDAEINAYLEKNPGWGVLDTYKTTVHIARMDDKGTPVKKN